MFVNLNDYSTRRDDSQSADAIAQHLRNEFAKVQEAQVAVFGPPPVRGVGRAGGFTMMVEDRGDVGPQVLQAETDNLVRAGNATPGLIGLFTMFRANVPQINVEPDRRACLAKGVTLQDFADTLAIYEGSLYVNDFNLFGRTWQVNVQADAAVPRPDRGPDSACRAQQPGGHGPDRLAGEHQADQRAARADALQHVSGRLDQRHVDAGVEFRAGHRPLDGDWPGGNCRRTCRSSGPTCRTSK